MKVAVVSGASRGIGRATALELARRGVGLVLVGRVSQEAERTSALARDAGAPLVRSFGCDLSDTAATERTALELTREFPAPDIVVNNAGVAPRLTVEQTTPAIWDETFSVNLRAPFVLTRALLPGMRAARRGRIVHVGSISSTVGTAGLSAYCATKWALIGFMKSLAAELTDSGVVTLAVLPGSTSTRMLEGSSFPARMTPEEVAKTIVHYTLDAPAAHNGAVIEMFGI